MTAMPPPHTCHPPRDTMRAFTRNTGLIAFSGDHPKAIHSIHTNRSHSAAKANYSSPSSSGTSNLLVDHYEHATMPARPQYHPAFTRSVTLRNHGYKRVTWTAHSGYFGTGSTGCARPASLPLAVDQRGHHHSPEPVCLYGRLTTFPYCILWLSYIMRVLF